MESAELECPRCGGALAGLRCAHCGKAFDVVLGVPFLGDFEAEDALGLIEIAANAPHRAGLVLPPGTVEHIDALCAGYHAAGDKAAFIAANPGAQPGYFANRYQEWLEINALLEGLALSGRDVLDIGAGQGFDSQRLALRGARVTALEFSPILAEAGRIAFPELRWIGGFGHALPFRTASFDAVFLNAALHHMRDIPATIAEALRVLRPGGTLVTTGDPFRSASSGQALEFAVFDRHEAVLSGINEQIPPLSDFLAPLERHRGLLEVELFTSVLHGGRSGRGPELAGWTRWDFATEAELLKRRSGSLAMRVRLRGAWPEPRRRQEHGVLPPASFAAWLEDPATATARLAAIVPPALRDTPFPGRPSKFDLLNGWRVARSTGSARTAYRRGRLFRTRRDAAPRFRLRSPVPARFSVLVNGVAVGGAAVASRWTELAVDLAGVSPGAPYVLELRREGEAASFDEACFEVREVGQPSPAVRLRNWLGAAGRLVSRRA
ncbi:MAG TPA: class I SAM-dependent methyltransferase [Crenalkalicoccus sp.]|nr:class I SAM-dependent methyltransferase [Crenalkalicoccus sp.]